MEVQMLEYAVTYLSYDTMKDYDRDVNAYQRIRRVAAKTKREAARDVEEEDDLAVVQYVCTVH